MEKKGKNKNKKIIIISSIVLALLIIASIGMFLFKTDDYSFTVTVKSGEVQVLLKNNEWQTLTETENIFKYIKAVETKDGEAVLSIEKSNIITIEPNSRIDIEDVLDDTVIVEQKFGSSWNKFLSLSGIKNFDVKTSHTVASVRGTSFFIEITENSSIFILGEGELHIQGWNQTLQPFEKVIVHSNNTIELVNLTDEEVIFIKTMIKEDLDKMKFLRNQVFEKYDNLISTIKKLTKTTDEDFKQMINDFDSGVLTEEEMINQSPVSLPDEVNEVVKLNMKIREQIDIINQLESQS